MNLVCLAGKSERKEEHMFKGERRAEGTERGVPKGEDPLLSVDQC